MQGSSKYGDLKGEEDLKVLIPRLGMGCVCDKSANDVVREILKELFGPDTIILPLLGFCC